jgi:AcrR family transcriptional regulator
MSASPKSQAVRAAPEMARATRGRLAVSRSSRQRATLMAAMTELAAERGWQSVPVELLCERAGMSKRTFYGLFGDREDCFVAAVERAAHDISGQVRSAAGALDGPLADRVARALATLIYELDVDRHRAWLLAVEASNGSGRAREVRDRALAPLAVAIDGVGDGLGPATGAPAVGAIVELVYRHLTGPDAERALTALGAPAAFLVFAPLEGRRAALVRAEAIAVAAAGMDALPATAPPAEELAPGLKLTRLTEATILYLAEHPGACNVVVAAGVGVEHDSQMSRHLRRLERAGAARASRDGRTNAWELTPLGLRLASQLCGVSAA